MPALLERAGADALLEATGIPLVRADVLWARQQAANAACYAGFPVTSCSVEGHAGARAFREFIDAGAGLAGFVLDVGCGPQPVPLYLEDYHLPHVFGIDPLPPAAGPHPFAFVQGRAEDLPWPVSRFGTVVAATSLDHLVDPAQALREVRRVLHPAGRFYVWGTFWPDAAPYDPADPPADLLADGCHAYHLGPWFRALLDAQWETVREQAYGRYDRFLELAPR